VLLVILVTFLTGCKGDGLFGDKKEWPCDDGDIKTMRFVQYGTLTPIEGAQVYLYSYAGSEEWPSQMQFKVSDANGYVAWPCEYAVTEICAEAEGCWDDCGYGYDMKMTWVADGIYELFPQAWAKITVVDDEPLNPEYLVFVGDPMWSSPSEPIGNGMTEFRECVGNRPDLLRFWVNEWDNDITDYTLAYVDDVPINIAAFDTLVYTFHY
jgi:hypothetical protein